MKLSLFLHTSSARPAPPVREKREKKNKKSRREMRDVGPPVLRLKMGSRRYTQLYLVHIPSFKCRSTIIIPGHAEHSMKSTGAEENPGVASS